MKKNIICAWLILLSISCNTSDASESYAGARKLNIVVIGNSITSHPVNTDLGWFNDWGMAATAPENDFCGILSKKYNVEKLKVPYWEISLRDSNFPPAVQKKIDVLIIEMGENVSVENYPKYEEALTDLILRYKQKNTRVILVSNFWHDPEKDRIEKKVCDDNGYDFVDISSIHGDLSYQAQEYQNPAVACHPNDKGMKFIAEKIQEKL